MKVRKNKHKILDRMANPSWKEDLNKMKKAELVELEKVKNAFADKISTIDKYIINIIKINKHLS